MTFLIYSRPLACAKSGTCVSVYTYTILICLECRDDVLDSPFHEHASDKTKAFAIRLLGECFVERG